MPSDSAVAVPVDAGARPVGRGGVQSERVAGDGATAFGRENVTGAHGFGEVRRRDRHRLEAESAGHVAREALHVGLAAGECAHGIDAFGCEEVAARASVCGQHRFDAEIGGEFIPQHLAAAEPDPRLQVLWVETVIAGEAREVGEAAMGFEVVVLAGEIEVRFATCGGPRVRWRRRNSARRGCALRSLSRCVGRGDALDQRGRRSRRPTA